MKLILGSDLHLDHVSSEERKEFLERVAKECNDPDCVLLLTGDLTSQRTLLEHIDNVAQACRGKMLYVLGNHDFWGGSFAEANTTLRIHGRPDGHAVFMDLVERVQLEEDLCVVGDSGWYDGRNGLQGAPRFIMNDWFFITEYKKSMKSARTTSAMIADARATILEKKLRSAVAAGNNRIIVLTHCPPWVEACRHMGRPSDTYALPWFSSQVIADVIDQVAKEHFHVKFEVLCGHTHDRYGYQRDDNLFCYVSGAAYGAPYVREYKPRLW